MSLADEVLVDRVRAGDRSAADELAKRYFATAGLEARSYNTPGVDQDDKVGVALIGLSKAIQNYQSGRGSTFASYAKLLMRNALRDQYRSVNRAGEIPGNVILSLDGAASREGGDGEELADLVPDAVDAERELVEMLDGGATIDGIEEAQASNWASAFGGLPDRASGRLVATVLAYARRTMRRDQYDGLVDLIGAASQPRLFSLGGPCHGSAEADSLIRSVFEAYASVQYLILSDLACGYTHQEIADRLNDQLGDDSDERFDEVVVARIVAEMRDHARRVTREAA